MTILSDFRPVQSLLADENEKHSRSTNSTIFSKLILVNDQILAVTWNAVGDHGHIVLYQSGKSQVRSSEELTTRLLDEIKSEEPK